MMPIFHRDPSPAGVGSLEACAFIDGNEGPSLSDVAGHIGLTLPSMSKIVDGLLARKLITREVAANDRRRVTLALTSRGETLLKTAREATKSHLADKLHSLSPADRVLVINALDTLRPIFSHQHADINTR